MARILFSIAMIGMTWGLCLCLLLGLTAAITSGGISESHAPFQMNSLLFLSELLLCFWAGFGYAAMNGAFEIKMLLPSVVIALFFGILISLTCTIPSENVYRFLRPPMYCLLVLAGGIAEHFITKHRKP